MIDTSVRFESVFDRVKESSDRTRSALYVFMIVNFALFLTVYGADLYRRPLERLGDFVDAVVCAKKKLDDKDIPRPNGRLNCRTAKENAAFAGYDLDRNADVQLSDGGDKLQGLPDFLLRKRLEALVGEEVATNRVQVPLVGFTFDIEYLWLLASFFGPLGMIVVVSCLRKELEEIRFAREYLIGDNETRSFRARLLLSTQVLLRRSMRGSDDVDGWFAQTASFARRAFVYSIFLLPLLTQAIMVYYDGFFVDIFSSDDPTWTKAVQYFWDDLGAEWKGHPYIQTFWLATTVASTVTMILSVVEFFQTTNDLRREYSQVDGVWFPSAR
jgi:hypothetical protein